MSSESMDSPNYSDSPKLIFWNNTPLDDFILEKKQSYTDLF